MANTVLDSSAILALLNNETGSDEVIALMEDQSASIFISTVNFCEVVTRLVAAGVTDQDIFRSTEGFRRFVTDFDLSQSDYAGGISRLTKSIGLSLGDRACLALAQATGGTAWTTDRAWKRLKLPIPIKLLRD